jgi:HPt (histidine-containing phosphotransfer) domain-containing protein
VNDPIVTIAALLRQHRTAYLHALPARLGQLATLERELENPGLRVSVLPALERLAHSLAGSAGTFGFDALGDAARELELAVCELLEGGDGAQRDLRCGTAALRGELQRALAAAPQAETLQ